MTDIVRATPADAGCYVDGSWGQFGNAHLIYRAIEFGYDNQQAIDLAMRHLATIGGLGEGEFEALIDLADDAERWLNEHAAPQGYQFGWYDGEFFLWSELDWDEVGI